MKRRKQSFSVFGNGTGFGKRNIKGDSVSRFNDEFEDVLDKWIGMNLLEWANDYLRLTKRGLFLANEVFVDFL